MPQSDMVHRAPHSTPPLCEREAEVWGGAVLVAATIFAPFLSTLGTWPWAPLLGPAFTVRVLPQLFPGLGDPGSVPGASGTTAGQPDMCVSFHGDARSLQWTQGRS